MSKHVALWISIGPALVVTTALLPRAVRAEGAQIRLQADVEYIHTDVARTNEDENSPDYKEETDTDFSWLKERYKVELEKELYPYLKFLGGGYFELIDTETDTEGTKTGFKERTGRLFGELDLTNPLYTAGAAYRRREFKFDPRDMDSLKIFREEVSGLWNWKPVGLPSVDVDYNRFHTWDDGDTRDTVLDLLVVKTRYDYEEFSSDYTYTRNDQEERISGGGSLTQVHNGGMRYPRSFHGDRIRVTGAARLNYETLEPLGGGEINLPSSSPGAAFYFTDDTDPTTLTVVDAANPLTNVNIGGGAPLNPVSVGLNFGSPTEVDTLYVLPLEDLTNPTLATPGEIASVAGSFAWTVFTSNDQLNWTEEVVTSATYNVFDNRFEIRFAPTVDPPFIKVVTTPLSSTTKEIRIERVQAFTTITAEPGLQIENFTQTYNLGVRWAVTNKTTATYDSSFRRRTDDPFDQSKSTLTNGVGLQHRFNPRFYANARVLRSDIEESNRPDTVRHTYTASLAADYHPSLNQRLVYSGNHDDEGGRFGYGNSIFLRTNADVYRDWAVNFDLGYSMKNPVVGPSSTATTFRLGTNIVPHRTMNFSIDYLGSWDTETDQPSGFSHIARFRAFWVPLRTLSMSANLNLRKKQRDERGLQNTQNYSVSWAPFPDGLLNFVLSYNQTIDIQGTESKILTPEVNWQVTRTSLLTVSFDYGTIESDIEKRDLQQIRANFRIYY